MWRSLYPDAAATLTMPHASVSLAAGKTANQITFCEAL